MPAKHTAQGGNLNLADLASSGPGVLFEYREQPTAEDLRFRPETQSRRFADRWVPFLTLNRDDLLALVHPDDVETALRELREITDARGSGVVRTRLLKTDGETIWADLRVSVHLAEGGDLLGLRGIASDVSSQQWAVEVARQRELEFRNLSENAPDLIARFDRDLRHIYVNAALCKATKLTPADILGKTHMEVGQPVGYTTRWSAWVNDVFLTGRERVVTFEQGAEPGKRFYHARIIPERDKNGDVASVLTVVRDMSERHRAEEVQRFLGEASHRLSATLDFAQTLDIVMDLAVPFLGDICTVDLVQSDGKINRSALRMPDASAEAMLNSGVGPPPYESQQDVGVPRVVRTGQSEVVEHVTDEWFAEIGAGPRLIGAMKAVGIESIITVPLKVRDRIIGAISFASSKPERRYRESDLVFAEDLGGRCAMAIENAGLFRQVEEMNRSKDEFIAMLGHELRNPLAAISNGLQAAQAHHRPGVAEFHNVYAEMRRQVSLISRFVDDLLDVTRVTHGLVHLQREPLDLAEVLRAAARDLQSKSGSKGQSITLDLPESGIPLVADPVRIHQILSNLLQNAIKYTPRGGRIEASAVYSLGWASISVRDNGIGMSPDLVARVFDLFSQADTSLDRNEGGIGIGLALVKRLTEMHGGTVEAFSNGPGEGSEFVVRLPLLDKRASTVQDHLEMAMTDFPAGQRRVLLADDNEFAVRMLAQALESSGHAVTVARDGVSAVRLASESRPQVALLDIGLPGMDGYEVARRLRSDPTFNGLHLIALTGYGGEEDRRKSKAAGFDEHLVKPVDFDTVERMLHSRLA